MDQIKRLFASLSVTQRWTILLLGIVSAAAFYGIAHWQTENGFRPLYNSLAPEDAAVVVQKLKDESVPYRLSSNNSTISVPEDKVAELRLEMAGAGVPKNGRIGFEIFDKANFGMTDFAEHINYRRALEGELERSVMSISQVEQARVHISFPQESVFTESREPAKASVLVKIRPGDALPDSAMPAITNLISSAVEGLAPEAVSVLDMRGNLLNRAKRANGNGGGDVSDSALEYRQKVEQDLTAKLNSTLEPLVGAGRFRAAVSAECDMTSGEQSEENFDPTKSVMVSSQRTEDSSNTTHAPEGIPGTASNLPEGAAKAPAGSGTSRKTENVNYETSHTVKRTVIPQGGIKRLSVSVLLDQDSHWEGTGAAATRILVPPTPERLKVIHDLVAAATGLNTERGDQLIVESLPFESTLNSDPPALPESDAKSAGKKLSPVEQLKSQPKLMIGAAAALVAILGGVFFAIRAMKKRSADATEAYATPSLPPGASDANSTQLRPSSSAGQDAWVPSSSSGSALPALGPARMEVLTKALRETAQKDTEICAGVLRGWLREERS